ncbi:MAG: DUF3775 domain-containing protein [Rhodospirillaceae bacterium]|nr:DUF3775 domain-containing protein [Rhodospirillaceae bacterium]
MIVRARELEAKVEVDEPDSGSNPSDDMAVDVLEDSPDDPTRLELQEFLDSLNEDEQVHLVALARVGRGGYGIEGWDEAVPEAARARNEHTAAYLLGMPMLVDYLEQGLAAHGLDCAEYQAGRL